LANVIASVSNVYDKLVFRAKKFSNENYSNFFQKISPVTEQYLDLNYRQGVDLDP
jgi:hypothetical protein